MGYKDIYYHLYYCMTGWYGKNSIRNLFLINESISYPNVCGAYVIWTQGDAPPYKIYFANFGYPIGISETVENTNSEYSIVAFPNPFQRYCVIKFQIPSTESQTNSNFQNPNKSAFRNSQSEISLSVYDVTGHVVKFFNPVSGIKDQVSSIVWYGADEFERRLPAGVYFIKIEINGRSELLKVVKID
ncbi:MAG: T9SS type A sorting domain-containing protein [candidate division WOR-3 bacterium]